jgi:DNA repair protein RecO (recombination protein O)
MIYRIYTTEGIILAKRDFGEAERLFYIYTEQFGMILAVARGARYIKSKLRSNLGLFDYNNFSLINAKETWKITDVGELKKFEDFKNLSIFARVAGFLTRMVRGEEKNNFIWEELKRFFLTPDSEVFFLAKILHNLGYMPEIPESKKNLIPAVNRAIRESML